jgi:hypothetical protein
LGLDGGGGQLHAPDALPPVPIANEAGWAPDSPIIIRVIKSRKMTWVGYVARHRADENAHKVFVAKPKGKKPFGRPRYKYKWENNIEMDLK